MKKIFFCLVAALVAANVFAGEVTVSKSVSALCKNVENGTQKAVLYSDGVLTVSVNDDGNNGKVYSDGAEWRVYQTNNAVITVSVKNGTIKTVSFEYGVKNTGTLLFKNNQLESGAKATVNASSAKFEVGNTKSGVTNGQVKVTAFTVVYDGEAGESGGGEGGEGEGTEIAGLAYADAYYYDYEGVNYWDFDLYKDFDWEEFNYVYPELYLSVKAKSATKIAGTYTLDYAGLWRSAKDSVEIDEEGAVLTISYVDVDTYKFEGQFLADDGQTYSFSSVVELYAYDDATGEDIILEDDGSDQAVENATVTSKATKTIKEGMLIVEKNGRHYNVLGQLIR